MKILAIALLAASVIISVFSLLPQIGSKKNHRLHKSIRPIVPQGQCSLIKAPPASACHSASDAFSISSNKRKLNLIFSV
jgi:hypothetical protein